MVVIVYFTRNRVLATVLASAVQPQLAIFWSRWMIAMMQCIDGEVGVFLFMGCRLELDHG